MRFTRFTLIVAALVLTGATTTEAACLSSYGCSSGGIDLRDQSGRPDLYGNRYESEQLRQQQRDAYERQQYEQRNRALNNGLQGSTREGKCGIYPC